MGLRSWRYLGILGAWHPALDSAGQIGPYVKYWFQRGVVSDGVSHGSRILVIRENLSLNAGFSEPKKELNQETDEFVAKCLYGVLE